MIDDKADKLNNDRLPGQPESSTEYGGLEAELQKNLGQAVKNEMDVMTEEEMVEIYENSNTLKGMVAKRKKELMDEKEEEKKKRFFLLVKFGSVAGLLGIVIIFASIAWFVMSKDVDSGSMAVSIADGSAFNLATKEEYISYLEKLQLVDDDYQSGSSITLYDDKESSNGTFYMIDGGNKLIIQCHDNGNTVPSGDKDISPGSWDKVNLYLVPNNDGDISVEVNIEVIPFAEIEKKDSSGNTLYELDDNDQPILVNGKKVPKTELIKLTTPNALIAAAATFNNTITQDEANKYIKAADYLKGHIMFFGGEGDTTNADETLRYYFTNPYCKRTFTFSKSNVQTDTAYEIPIYWMWPNTLGQIALPDNNSGQRKGYPIVQDSNTDEKDALIDYLQDPINKQLVFENHTEIEDYIIENAEDSANFKLLSDGYNKADYNIGTYISYFMIEITVNK